MGRAKTMNKSCVFLLVFIFLSASCAIAPLPVQAESRTIVVPYDYSTIQEAIDAAKEGDTIFIKKGIYEEPINNTLEIDKTISIIGENSNSTIIKLYPAYNVTWILTQPFYEIANAATIVANDIILANLTIEARPRGDISLTGDRSQILNNNITTQISIKGSYSNITGNTLEKIFGAQGSFNTIARNHVSYIRMNSGNYNFILNNTCLGIDLDSSHQNIISGNKLETTSYGYSGISLSNSNNNLICRNKVSGFNFGLELFFSSRNSIIANTIADSSTTIRLGGSNNNTFCLNNFVDNKYWYNEYVDDTFVDPWFRDTYPNATVSTNFWYKSSLGNHWGNYNGSDMNYDGIGETPYTMKIKVRYFEGKEEEVVCGEDAFPLMSNVDIDSASIELPEWASSILNPSPTPSPSPETTAEPEPFSTALVLASVATATIVGLGLLVYFKKRKH